MKSLLLFNFLGPEMLVVFFAILLLFGGKKIPELMRGLGKGIKEFNNARSAIESELKEGMRDADRKELEERREKEREELRLKEKKEA
ncbi:MAG: twin-arginine translocase TatA/TatE family subunit [Saprospiraceae bacterium]|nr:twin-arginine translocase TatA/TatE family subunit [Saprospiraceae bacterium]MCB9324732.1 twin-arginine translocase TatA/TatE family subunit [Lewinellaceae bacterium]